jgi:MFS family permease
MANWYQESSSGERRTFWACFLGWGLDALDVQMFSLSIPALIATFGVGKTEAGAIGSITLFAGAFGGWIGGAIADRFGRVKALQITVAWFAVATFACAFAQTYTQFVVLKAVQGLGFGGEWAAGAVLMAEIIRPQHRGKALAAVQSAWAVGWGGAVLFATAAFYFMPQEIAWRVLFGFGLLPAMLIFYVRRKVPEPPHSEKKDAATARSVMDSLFGVFRLEVLRPTLVGGLFGIGAHGGYAALTTFLPTFLRQDRGLSVLGSGAYLAVIIIAFFCGCVVSGIVSDRIGRRINVVLFAAACVVTVLVYIFAPLSNAQMLILGFPLGFFSAGIPASMAALFSELYPEGVRGTGVGFCYNFGRIVSAAFPVMVGFLSERIGLGPAIGFDAAFAYSLVLIAVLMLPETRGKSFAHQAPTAVEAAARQNGSQTRHA